MRAIHAGASTVSEPLLRPNPPEASWHPTLRLVGQPVAAPQHPFSVVLVDDKPHHRNPREDEVLAIGSNKED
jgi:hypothetical protein